MAKIERDTRFNAATAQLLASSKKSDAIKSHWYIQLYRRKNGSYFLRHSNPSGTRRFGEPIRKQDAMELYTTLPVKYGDFEIGGMESACVKEGATRSA
jgi:hypothetical protein